MSRTCALEFSLRPPLVNCCDTPYAGIPCRVLPFECAANTTVPSLRLKCASSTKLSVTRRSLRRHAATRASVVSVALTLWRAGACAARAGAAQPRAARPTSAERDLRGSAGRRRHAAGVARGQEVAHVLAGRAVVVVAGRGVATGGRARGRPGRRRRRRCGDAADRVHAHSLRRGARLRTQSKPKLLARRPGPSSASICVCYTMTSRALMTLRLTYAWAAHMPATFTCACA